MSTLSNVTSQRGETNPQSVRFTPDASPEAESSKTGVSVWYVSAPNKRNGLFFVYHTEEKTRLLILWWMYGTYTYIAKKIAEKFVKGKRKRYLQTLIPNLLFAYTTAEKAEEYVNNTPAISYLSYYYNHFKLDNNKKNPALTVSDEEMNRFILATCNRNEHLLFVQPSQCHFKGGEQVRIIDGEFAGVEGRVARVAGQQRVVLSLSGIGLISTAYIPTAFLRPIDAD